jgi:hypothetical protein
MNTFFQKMPLEIVIYILQFDNIIKYRNGKFINQIDINDKKYALLNNYSQITPKLFNRIYTRDLGMSYVSLYVNNMSEPSKYTYTFSRKKQDNDTSIRTRYIYVER